MKLDQYLSPAELRRLLSALLVVLGFIAIAALFGFTLLPGLRYQAHTSPESAVKAVQGDTGWLDPTDTPVMAKQIIPPLDPKTVMTPNPELMTRAKAVYEQTCATCHGSDGKGNGPGGTGLTPKPRNFTVGEGWKNGTTLEGMYRTLEEGIKGSSMVSYTYLSRKDRMGLAHYVQSLGTFPHTASDPKALAALEKLFASTGEVIPNRIPLRRATDRLLQESTSAPVLPKHLNPAILDAERAAQTLAGLPGWATNEQVLAKGVIATLPGNGFAPEVATYAPAQWKALRATLSAR